MRRCKLASFEATHHIADINAQTQSDIAALADLDGKIASTQADSSRLRAQLANVQSQSGTRRRRSRAVRRCDQSGRATTADAVSQVQFSCKTAEQQYTDQHPQVIALKQQEATASERNRAATARRSRQARTPCPIRCTSSFSSSRRSIQAQAAADQAQISVLTSQRNDMNPTSCRTCPAQAAMLADLQRNSQSAQDVYTALQQKFNNANVAKDTALSDVTVTQPALANTAQRHRRICC